jgi:uncharacterized membrane protein (UPF0136 family)
MSIEKLLNGLLIAGVVAIGGLVLVYKKQKKLNPKSKLIGIIYAIAVIAVLIALFDIYMAIVHRFLPAFYWS